MHKRSEIQLYHARGTKHKRVPGKTEVIMRPRWNPDDMMGQRINHPTILCDAVDGRTAFLRLKHLSVNSEICRDREGKGFNPSVKRDGRHKKTAVFVDGTGQPVLLAHLPEEKTDVSRPSDPWTAVSTAFGAQIWRLDADFQSLERSNFALP
ncbi:hypothetical protein B0H17DRAFT_1138681 [Mycena rosella]|uniref:Uncharacterized protein n=1 Tax=Mycena rosella TaxID=1033263 RepID=A0AAD7D607_MYCRO|nr:hypothetical protein B0H17DRAFT_1138681 [Mycena rosella]